MCVCILFVKALRLPSLRVASVFLGLMFFYDIFMVRRVSPPHPSDALTYPRLPCNFSRSDPGTPPTPLLPHRLPLPPPLPLPQVFISPMIFHKSIMVAVATAGQSTASVSTGGVCERTEGDTFPMLFLVPRMHAILTPFDGVYIPPLPPPPPYSDPSLDSLPWYLPTRGGLLWRIS